MGSAWVSKHASLGMCAALANNSVLMVGEVGITARSTPTAALLQAENLVRRYGPRVAVNGVSIGLAPGEVLGLLGLNGAGKSTTLQLLTGVLAPHRGWVRICGHDVQTEPLAAKAQLGYLPEIPPLYPDNSVSDYLRYCARLRRVPAARVRVAVDQALACCELDAVRDRTIRHLSKGYQQRVGIAQAIVHEPAVLVLDEPTVGLDPVQITSVRRLIKTLTQERAAILSTHLLGEVDAICTRVVILHHGRIVHCEALTEHDTEHYVRLLLRTSPALSVLRSIPGVKTCKTLAATEVVVELEDETALTNLLQAILRHGWGLRELTPAGSSLEQIFLAHTQQVLEIDAATPVHDPGPAPGKNHD